MAKRGNGEGSIVKRKDGRWQASYSYNGKRKFIYGKTRNEVKDKLNKTLVNIVDNKYVDRSNFTLNQIIKMNIEEQLASNKISAVTYKRKVDTLKIIETFSISKLPIQQINSIILNEELLKLNHYSNSVIIKVSQMIRNAFDKALILNMVNNNPYNIKGLINVPKSNKMDKKVEALTIEEQKLLINELDKKYDEYNNVFYIALYTGMRVGEILALNESDIDLKNKLIRVNKTITRDENDKFIIGKTTKTYAGTRDIPITHLIEFVFHKLPKNKTIFTDSDKIISTGTINSHFKKICKNAGVRVKTIKRKKGNGSIVNLADSQVNTHMLRHTYATRCIEAGVSAVVLSKLLGHADIETTLNTYTSVFNKFKDDEIKKYLDYIAKI